MLFEVWLRSLSPACSCFCLLVVKYASEFKAIDVKKAWVPAADGAFDRGSPLRISLSSKPNTIVLCKQTDSKSSIALAYKDLTWDFNSLSTSFIRPANLSTATLKLSFFTYIPKLISSNTKSSLRFAIQQKTILPSFLRL